MADTRKQMVQTHNTLVKMHKVLTQRGEKGLAEKVKTNVKAIRQELKGNKEK